MAGIEMVRRGLSWRRRRTLAAVLIGAALCAVAVEAADRQYWTTGVAWDEPKVVEPAPVDTPGGPPSDAVVLFDGKTLDAWHGGDKWTIRDGYAICGGSDITTKEAFGDCQLHLEWLVPATIQGKSQARGNSGVFLMGEYEIQILESYRNENKTYVDGMAAAVYKQRPPIVNACRKPGEWQTYDVIFKAPRWDEKGKLLTPAFITLLHNGVLVQNHFELLGHTNYRKVPRYDPLPAKLPLTIQNHHNPIHFRNIWIRPLEDDGETKLKTYREKLAASRPAK